MTNLGHLLAPPTAIRTSCEAATATRIRIWETTGLPPSVLTWMSLTDATKTDDTAAIYAASRPAAVSKDREFALDTTDPPTTAVPITATTPSAVPTKPTRLNRVRTSNA